MNNGWIKIHRKLLEWEWYDEPNTFRLFIHLLLKANHKPKNYRGVNILEGQVMTGFSLLAEQTGLTVQKVRTALNNLKSTNEITIKSGNKGTVIQIVKYLDYQVVTNKTTNEQQTDNKQVTTNKNVNNKKNVKNIDKSVFIPPSEAEFMLFAKSKFPTPEAYQKVRTKLLLKYESWVESDWVNGRTDKKIKKWKATLLNTIPHL